MSNPAYFIFDATVHNPEGMQPYRAKVADILKAYHGTLLVGGGTIDAREGTPPQGSIVVLRFDSMEAARAWYESPEYQSIIGYRHAAAQTDAFIVEGISM